MNLLQSWLVTQAGRQIHRFPPISRNQGGFGEVTHICDRYKRRVWYSGDQSYPIPEDQRSILFRKRNAGASSLGASKCWKIWGWHCWLLYVLSRIVDVLSESMKSHWPTTPKWCHFGLWSYDDPQPWIGRLIIEYCFAINGYLPFGYLR